MAPTLTLPDKGLAGVQQDLTALDDHPLYRQVFPDVFGLAHFIVHYPEGWRGESQSWAGVCTSFPQSLWTRGGAAPGKTKTGGIAAVSTQTESEVT